MKLNDKLKEEIIFKIDKGTKIKDIMTEYGLSRSTIQRINKNFDLKTEETTDNEREDSNNDSSSESSNISIIDELNENIELETVRNEPKKTEMNDPNLEQQRKAAMNFLNEQLKPRMTQQELPIHKQPQMQSVTIKNDLLDKDYPQKKTLINQIKRYINEFPEKLIDIIGNSDNERKIFMIRLNELEVHQLEILLENIRFNLAQSKIASVFNASFFLLVSQFEKIGTNYNYKIQGLATQLQDNKEVNDCLRELSCKYDVTSYISPEIKLVSCIALTALSMHQKNSLSDKMNEFLSEKVEDDLINKYNHL